MSDDQPEFLCRNGPELVCIDNSPVASVIGTRDPLQADPAGFDYLRGALEDLVASAQNFAAIFINDTGVRANYIRKIRQMADDVLADARAGRITADAGAEFAHGMREQILQQSRRGLSSVGLAFSEAEKVTSKTLAELIEKYAAELFPGRQFIALTTAERRAVFLEIVDAAGRDSFKWTRVIAPRLRLAGRGCALFTAAIVIYDVWTAQNKVEAGLNDALVLGGGALGGAVAGAATGLLCGPAAPFCSTALFVVGGIMGAMAGQAAAGLLRTEIHEFSSWLGDL